MRLLLFHLLICSTIEDKASTFILKLNSKYVKHVVSSSFVNTNILTILKRRRMKKEGDEAEEELDPERPDLEELEQKNVDFWDKEEEDEETVEEEEEEEEIIFTPEQEKMSKPFEVSTHQDTHSLQADEEEDGRTTPVSDTNEQSHSTEEEDHSESSVDDDAIIRDLTSLEPPPK
ncbi:hypothetical protein G6F68_014579 [Rhizopus microsporus]|nr:hypothetical protein G6F68_014579 [Rhizopus microsporus]